MAAANPNHFSRGKAYDLAEKFTRFDCVLAVSPGIAGTLDVALDLGGAKTLSIQTKPDGVSKLTDADGENGETDTELLPNIWTAC